MKRYECAHQKDPFGSKRQDVLAMFFCHNLKLYITKVHLGAGMVKETTP